MPNPQYLSVSRHGLYYFRFTIPQALHPEHKPSCLRISLNTRCPRESLQLSRMLGYAGDQLIRHAGIQGMEYQQIRAVLQEHFGSLIDRRKQHQALHGSMQAMDRTALSNSHALAMQSLKDKDYLLVATDDDMSRMIDSYAMPIQPNTKDYDVLRVEFLKAFRDYCATALKDDDELSGYDFSSSGAKAPKQKARKLADSISEYCNEKERLKKWRPKSAKGYRKQFDLLLRLLGQEASLHVSLDVATDVKSTLLRLPKNLTQKANSLGTDIAALVAKKLPEKERLNPVTVAKHIRTYSTFYDWAVQHKRTSENNFSVLVDDVKKVHTPREDFDENDIERIMAAVMDSKKPHQKWGVLIAFYTGARLNEIAQMETTDIKKAEGIDCFHFTNEGDFKSLKNDSSKRIIPIHSRLIELGFLDYVDRVGKGRLFPALTYHESNGYGRNLGRWFNDSLLRKQLEITSPALVFHSIRHTVAQQLRNNKVQEATLKDILGHSHAGVTMSVYASNLDKSVMQEAIETLSYA